MTSFVNVSRNVLKAIAWGYIVGIALALPMLPASEWPVLLIVALGAIGALRVLR